jgi:phytoene dehydrogenase-like protein
MGADVVVIGGGHNALVCAIYLARAGKRPLVLERNERLGGAIASAELTEPGFVHDVFATNQGAFAGGPVWRDIGDELARQGLRYATSDKPFASLFPDGTSLRVYQDAARTLAGLRKHDAGDASGWNELYRLYRRVGPTLLQLYGTALPSFGMASLGLRGMRRLGRTGMLGVVQLLLASTRELGDAYLSTPEARALVAAWGMHLDFGPDVSGGAAFPFLQCFGAMEHGMAIVEGGASRMVDALAAYLEELGGSVRTDAHVVGIAANGRRATAVQLASGESIEVRGAVVASVTPTELYVRLLPAAAVPDAIRRAAARFSYGPATMMVHLALREAPHWRGGPELRDFAYLHIAPYVEDLASTYTAAMAGEIPASPLLIVGQTSQVDPSRAPEGRAVLWIQVRALPAEIRGDAAGEIGAGDWETARDAVAERVMRKLEEYAPGIGGLVLGQAVLAPCDLEARNANLVGGDPLSGSHHLRQGALFRPILGWSRHRTPLSNVFLTGASSWPGAGVTGLPGYLAARRVRHSRYSFR